MLKDIYSDRLVVYEFPVSKLSGVKSLINAFRGYIDGVDSNRISEVLRLITLKNISSIFIDGSNFGELIRVIRKKYPEVKIFTFFHNVEAIFFYGSFLECKSMRSMGVAVVNYLTERKSVKYSNKIICLSKRDSRHLQRLYSRPANYISPMALRDQLDSTLMVSETNDSEQYTLFVGGDFYANQAGILWFVKNVSPRISIKTCVVGRGMEKFRDELEIAGKVEVVGEVDSLLQWYRDAYFVIAPIFGGSGMKTKVAEALMFGKKVLGTPEAFSGYEEFVDQAGRQCLTADEFVTAIESANDIVKTSFDPELRNIYETMFSYDAAKSRLERIMCADDI